MTDRTIASRPSMEQVTAIVDFMEKHPALALGQLRGMEGRDESKRLWFKLTRIVNNLSGPTRPMKSWIKYWADKKSTVRTKVISYGDGNSNNLCSNVEKKIWDLFLANDAGKTRKPVKQESSYVEDTYFKDDGVEEDNQVDSDPVMPFEEQTMDMEQRQNAIMERLVKAMSEQAGALAQLAQAAHVSAQAMHRAADAAQIQSQAIDRLATTFETINAATHDVRNALVDIDSTMKRLYSTPGT
ncbi:uncharacterized protein LOC113497467 isoform X2 [Trichoplusia ni]|uniref:Regulatory protein zeste n=1 Tax=Trichoplusia ni TaxID=7111 RepID=A0A7E5VXI8_TRINI|nr:uncharacterized protein LOC113497467 isoform X2 [Trichoplusia ni]